MVALCQYCGVEPKALPKHRCPECLLLKEPMTVQVQRALERRAASGGTSSSKPTEWPTGRRNCTYCGTYRRVDRDGLKLDQSPSSARCRACLNAVRTQSQFKISPEQLMGLQVIQKARCAICGKFQQKKSLATEHDHFTGDVRGLACLTDNQVIGMMHDNPVVFVAFACYLIDPPARRVGIGAPVMSTTEVEEKILEMVRDYRVRLGYK